MRLILVAIAALIATPALTLLLIAAKLLRVPDRTGSVYDRIPHWWARTLLWVAGVDVRVSGAEFTRGESPRIFVGNHVSWFDVLAAAAVLPRGKYVAKAELFRVPVFGQAIRWIGMIEIDRENRKAAFDSLERAAAKIRAGNPVVMFAEGTRGDEYALRPFKKGPFVLAIAAQVPVVPTVVHGAIAVQPRDSFRVRSGTVHVHFLEPVPTAGLGYEDRDRLSRVVWQRMADALRALYGIDSPPLPAARVAAAASAATTTSPS